MLPNPGGVDTGNEFVELYNGSDESVPLQWYYLQDGTRTYAFPKGAVIAAKSYAAWSDQELGIVLGNTTGPRLQLKAVTGEALDVLPLYENAPIDQSWARFPDAWQYTNRPTPAALNLVSVIEDETPIVSVPNNHPQACREGYYRFIETNRCRKIAAADEPTPCKDGQYRSEETGRCRNIALAGSTLTPCKEGQYRSEETRRCRSLVATVAATLKPCADDQFRNPATGRCKKIASTDDVLAPCDAGWERNAETHRCRKIKATDMPVVAFPVEPVKQASESVFIWWALGVVGLLAAGYAGWEWRQEIARLTRKIMSAVMGIKK